MGELWEIRRTLDISDYLDDKMRNNNMIMKKYANSTTNYWDISQRNFKTCNILKFPTKN